jgi:hypothetical protein
MTQHTEITKSAVDGLSVITAFATLFQVLPAIAALFSIVWTGMRIIEMITGKPFSEIIKRKDDENG